MLTHAQTNIYGDRIVMAPSKQKYVPLPTSGHGVRYFPRENKTATPVFNSMRPNPGINKRNETPRKDNNYNNGYPSSRSRWEANTYLPNIDRWFTPPVDKNTKYIYTHKLNLNELYKPELAPDNLEPTPSVPQPEPEQVETREAIKETIIHGQEKKDIIEEEKVH